MRPEHFRVGPPGAGVDARVTHVEHLGDVALVHTRVAGVDDPVIVKSTLAPSALPALQQAVGLNADRVLAFDAQGRAIATA